ncbi:MAG: hypothetical protein K9L30_15720 [Desulfobacterales bacterium]|nr:hypothetical protein [Desulfobacterales bacterium]
MINKTPVAIVGISGIFPGASDLETFWKNITDKVNTAAEIPAERWVGDADSIYSKMLCPDKTVSKRACLIKDTKFDLDGLNIDASLLKQLDPLYHMVLDAGRKAFASCNSDSIDKDRIGTILAAIALPTDSSSKITRKILGASFEEKLFPDKFNKEISISKSESLAARVTGFPAAILAEALGLGGGSYTLDAACASSLYAIKLACDELQYNRADTMLAGGISRPDCIYTQVGFSQLTAISPSGRCAPFDKKADGLVVGEGTGILVLKRLDDAIRDNDEIHAVIRGIGLSNDMRGNLLAPDSEGQLRAMNQAYEQAGWSPFDVDLIECHGTGTPAGDKAELNSLKTLWGESGWEKGQCAIGSIKSMTGHLLTAAGAAGLIKILLAIKNKTLPPSLNVNKSSASTLLNDSPFRVQTDAESWETKNNKPRRAAVSAFGFGGINAHLLIEEWIPNNTESLNIKFIKNKDLQDIAIVGMDTSFGTINSLRNFQELVFNGHTIIGKCPHGRWKGCDSIIEEITGNRSISGGYLKDIPILLNEFHIPPNEIPDILIQQMLMLKVAGGAMKDAGLPLRELRPRMGTIIGIEFDFDATNFHMRWHAGTDIQKWQNNYAVRFTADSSDHWIDSVKNAYENPLTPARTVGALGGIVASRVAREFRFGGPGFIVSGAETSGLKAVEIGVRSLQLMETDAMLIGAVDLAGDPRNIVTANTIKPFSKNNTVRPFDKSADGSLPGEGAAAIVLKRVDDAIKDGDRIYAIIKGTGSASGGNITVMEPSEKTYGRSLEMACENAGISGKAISYFETHGSGNASEDRVEANALNRSITESVERCAIGSLKPNIGHTGAASGLASLVKTGLSLFHEIIPPLSGYTEAPDNIWNESVFHMPAFPQYWLRDRANGPRTACTAAMTTDGNCMHVILEGFDYNSVKSTPAKVEEERRQPLGIPPYGLFIVYGDNRDELLSDLNDLETFISQAPDKSAHPGILAGKWYCKGKHDADRKYAVSIAAKDLSQLQKFIASAKLHVSAGTPSKMNGFGGVYYKPEPLGQKTKIAFVFPGSGNHYIGMGRNTGTRWPEILRAMDVKTPRLKTQLIPECYVPHRISWPANWEQSALQQIKSDTLNMIFGQVVHGGVISNLVKSFGVSPSGIIGYSLGESAGHFASGAWPNRHEMLKRMQDIDLFTTQLAGPCKAARQVWNIPEDEEVNWRVAVVNRPEDAVKRAIDNKTTSRLLIVNTPNECVIGGRKNDVESVIYTLGCEAVFLDGVVTVHCDAAQPAADAYRNLHLFPTTPPEGITYYSCANGKAHKQLTSESAADSILKQALHGFNFPDTIHQAYEDGFRIFLEMGPHASCTRMINTILGDKPHLAVSACMRGEDDYLTILKFLGTLTAERIPVDLDALYKGKAYDRLLRSEKISETHVIKLIPGGILTPPPLPEIEQQPIKNDAVPEASINKPENSESGHIFAPIIQTMQDNISATAELHEAFLKFSEDLTQTYADTFEFRNKLLEQAISDGNTAALADFAESSANIDQTPVPITPDNSPMPEPVKDVVQKPEPAFSRELCMEFAIGSIEKVLGPEFAEIDKHNVRVRLPDEPLMLVDRIVSIEGEKRSLGTGRIVTEHDVLPGAWYLDGGKAPVCISVESGQADLFLSSYLGIDHEVKGERSYRLLDAVVEFYRGLPEVEDTIQYDIRIDRFICQGDTWLFFFNFDGFIGEELLISMTNGCAGFFTAEEVKNSGGIIFTENERKPAPGNNNGFTELALMEKESFSDNALNALRSGDLSGCFGTQFEGKRLSKSLYLPDGKMHLIDRVKEIDPNGGRFGLGVIKAEADIHPDDWFLTCHFMDDMVMPGTLMYECCAHTLRVFMQRTGWITDKPGVCYEPVIGVKSKLKCRGPVTPETKHVIYEVEVREIGYSPEPYIIANAHMYADGNEIVFFENMALRMSGITGDEIKAIWNVETNQNITGPLPSKTILFDKEKIFAFTDGRAAVAFGDRYSIFNGKRFIAGLPGPPYSFIDRIVRVDPEPWVLKAGGIVDSEFDIDPDGWFFKADRSGMLPYCVILESVLQTCGWLSAYMGSALNSEQDLKYRNLGGSAVFHKTVLPEPGTIINRISCTKVSMAGDMIIEDFEMAIYQDGEKVFSGTTNFGFFTKQALSSQVGLRNYKDRIYTPEPEELENNEIITLPDERPFTPDDTDGNASSVLKMPAQALKMVHTIDLYLPEGGHSGLGYIRGSKDVNPDEWFFKAHFYQDPVCPGSLGVESFLQLLRYIALDRWPHLAETHRLGMMDDQPHHWAYRGQIPPSCKKMAVEASVTKIQDVPHPIIIADGFVKVDGLYIYELNNFGIKLVPVE